MSGNRCQVRVFVVAGAASGLCSGLSAAVQPLGVMLPGVLFGLAISLAIDRSVESLDTRRRAELVGCSAFAWLTAMVVCLLSARLPGFDNGLLFSAISGALAGGSGALVIGLGVNAVVRNLRSVGTVVAATIAGAGFGVLFMIVGILISDHGPMGHPFDDVVSFPLWQMGVAGVLPVGWLRRRNVALATRRPSG